MLCDLYNWQSILILFLIFIFIPKLWYPLIVNFIFIICYKTISTLLLPSTLPDTPQIKWWFCLAFHPMGGDHLQQLSNHWPRNCQLIQLYSNRMFNSYSCLDNASFPGRCFKYVIRVKHGIFHFKTMWKGFLIPYTLLIILRGFGGTVYWTLKTTIL